MNHTDRLAGIRQQMQAQGVSAYIIPSADPHISEYVPDRYKCIAFASGFTGSAGTLVITQDFAGLWTDARYFEQAQEQLAGSSFELVKLRVQHAPEYIQWLAGKLQSGETVAFDGRLMSLTLAQLLEQQLKRRGIQLATDRDYLEAVWENRPALPTAPAFLLDEQITGKSLEDKLQELRGALQEAGTAYHLISSLDDIAWLFNVRGSDVKCNPVVLSFALISQNQAVLFIDETKLSQEEKGRLARAGVTLQPYEAVGQALSQLPAESSIFLDPKRTCQTLFEQLPAQISVFQETNPTTVFKAIKNQAEVAHTRTTMVKDGVALTRFFKWLEENITKTEITEISAAEKLREFRAEQEGFVGESFDTIAGYREHGALPHYKATPESNVVLKPEGLFLLDSGGQYQTGTTDITRVISLGNLTEEEKTDYTLVLKGTIDGSTARFPKGTRGYQIDAITRKPLWDHARNYGHGTGHGVGFFLNVHEGPHTFNPTPLPVDIELGMITSVEPGIYRPGRYGIRIENLVLTVPDETNEFGEFYTFETLTQFLIDTAPVNKGLLEAHHIQWLNTYNQGVVEKLGPHLTPEELAWLTEKAKAI
ncbi:aminopeptidase P family protein [Rufibacter hautae]|uniref:Aminopeptidase P family protein n=1 Tax=Rufibacter hautae TaxID=2595005 RepID=A0A5B6TCG6_9BACT|nr:aminopeptidase P family protein [Rufibacter hautae]KAA3436641.1 aminopeptidase P family protein [Rufibacter hautae]